MALIDSKLTALRRKAAKNAVEVEHLVAFAVIGDASAIRVIRELAAEHKWSRSNQDGNAHVALLARWAEVVCAYLEGGCDALVAYARNKEQESICYATAVLEELKSPASILALVELSADVIQHLPNRLRDALQLASSINLALCFKNPPRIYAETARQIRSFLHTLLQHELRERDRATVVCALRGVGDDESIEMIRRLPKFSGPWVGIESLAEKAIRKRLKDASRQ